MVVGAVAIAPIVSRAEHSPTATFQMCPLPQYKGIKRASLRIPVRRGRGASQGLTPRGS